MAVYWIYWYHRYECKCHWFHSSKSYIKWMRGGVKERCINGHWLDLSWKTMSRSAGVDQNSWDLFLPFSITFFANRLDLPSSPYILSPAVRNVCSLRLVLDERQMVEFCLLFLPLFVLIFINLERM